MGKNKKAIVDILLTLSILVIFFLLCLGMSNVFRIDTLIPAIFTLAVFLVSFLTDGYLYGIIASLLSVLIQNFAFAFPYFAFNFSITENLVSAVIMLAITVMTCAMTGKLKQQEKVKVESAKEKMRANLLRAVSHDLRTPLTTIYGSSSAIVDKFDSLSKEQILQLASGINEDSQWLIGMVENLLSVTKIDNEGVKIIKTPTVLEELIDAVLVHFKKRYPNQKVKVEIPEEFIIIPMDVVLIEQVIGNILENAVKHAVGMTELELKVTVRDKKAVFEITDNGCGIEKDQMKTIFTGFFEKKNTPIDNQKHSMGIGLSVCASIIKAHDGRISVENKETGGCCFRFSLDMEEANHE